MIRLFAVLAALVCAAPALAQPVQLPAGTDGQNAIVIDTTQGRIVMKLRPDLAPKHAERIKLLAREKYYDNVPFHRVIAGFMAQTGDGQNKNGTGGSKYPNLPAEFSSTPFKRGVVGMASSQTLTVTNGLQFWLKADAGVTVAGGNVTVWKDESGKGNDASQADPTSQPTLIASAVNGKPAVHFDDTNPQFLAAADSPSLNLTGDITTFFDARFDDFATYRAVWAQTQVNQPGPNDSEHDAENGPSARGGAKGEQSWKSARNGEQGIGDGLAKAGDRRLSFALR
jgi:peptidylprolyl isomerase